MVRDFCTNFAALNVFKLNNKLTLTKIPHLYALFNSLEPDSFYSNNSKHTFVRHHHVKGNWFVVTNTIGKFLPVLPTSRTLTIYTWGSLSHETRHTSAETNS